MADGGGGITGSRKLAARSRRRDLLELFVAYGLILAVCWTPRPWQKWLWWLAVVVVAGIVCSSFEGRRAMGLRWENFFRSLWIVGVAFLAASAAIALADRWHTLRLPASPLLFVRTYLFYAIWAFVQQFLLQCFFLARLRRLLPGATLAAAAAALVFALAHVPSAFLVPVTLLWGFAACLHFLRYRNLYPLALAHAILGITIAMTVPGPVVHNMRVGLGYLTYGHGHRPARSAQP